MTEREREVHCLKSILHWFNHRLEGTLIVIMMGYFVFATISQVLARFVFQVSAPWTEESARYVFIWMTFIGASYAAQKSSHIRIDILETSIGGQVGKSIKLLSMILFLCFVLTLSKVGIDICLGLLENPQTSSVLRIPMVYVYAALPVGMLLTSFRLLQNLYYGYIAKGRGQQEGKG